uniref:Cadherin N-terminal domain-containing protein n=1 Tax=Poecilia reticulata TaxID=8081 RepID=A0A3P9Q2A7_POERE
MKRQVLSFLSMLCVSYALGQVSYIIPEEMPKGSVLGNVAHDLGLDFKRLKSGNARVFTGGSMEYIHDTLRFTFSNHFGESTGVIPCYS